MRTHKSYGSLEGACRCIINRYLLIEINGTSVSVSMRQEVHACAVDAEAVRSGPGLRMHSTVRRVVEGTGSTMI